MKNHFMFLQRSFAMLSLLMAALVAYAEFYDDRFKYTVNSDKETVTLHAKSGVTYEESPWPHSLTPMAALTNQSFSRPVLLLWL